MGDADGKRPHPDEAAAGAQAKPAPKPPRAMGYYLLISGQSKGFVASTGRFFLLVLSLLFSQVVRMRYLLYKTGLRKTKKLPRPVISVGNLTAGGTGKSPMVEYLAAYFLQHQTKPAVLTRGYKSMHMFDKDGKVIDFNDESLAFKKHFPGAALVQNASRHRGGLEAVEQHGAQVLILDDGFQHIQLARDLDIVLVDCLLPFGFNYMLPRGLLREPIDGIKRAQLIVLTRADAATAQDKQAIRDALARLAPDVPVCEAAHEPFEVEDLRTGKRSAPSILKDKRIWLVSSIGNPRAFRASVEQFGPKILYHAELPDHYHFTEIDIEAMKIAPIQVKAEYIVMTEKDAVKLEALHKFECPAPILIFRIRMKITHNEEALHALLRALRTQPAL